jgi:uncharacterized damage-inducible protein DinB
MSVGVSMEELLAWNDEASTWWKMHLEGHAELLELDSGGIGGAKTVQDLVRHIWGAELRWAQRLAGIPETPREAVPQGPLEALFDLHRQAMEIFRRLLANPQEDWNAPYSLDVTWLPPELRTMSRRKALAHTMFHAQRHWAQLATLMRQAGSPSGFRGDLLFSSGLA